MKKVILCAALTVIFLIGCDGKDAKNKPAPPAAAATGAFDTGADFTDNVNGVGLDMVFVEGGTFVMGCTAEQGRDCYDDENPSRDVTLGDFYLGKHEVTQKLWYEIMGSNPVELAGGDNLPVYGVSWNDIQKFIRVLNEKTGKFYRLPTEAMWEYAARGGNKSAGYNRGYKYSGSNDINIVAWYDMNSDTTVHPVGTRQPNELGLHDMSGNVWEWVSDWHGSYSLFPETDLRGPSSGSNRMCRGGSWRCTARRCRVTVRNYYAPSYDGRDMGFRLALSSSVKKETSSEEMKAELIQDIANTEESAENEPERTFFVAKSDWEGVECKEYDVDDGYTSIQECIFPDANMRQVYNVIKKIGMVGAHLKTELPATNLKYASTEDGGFPEIEYQYKSKKHLSVELFYEGGVDYIEIMENEGHTQSKITYSTD